MRLRLANWMGAVVIATLAAACAQTDPGITTAVKSKLAADDQVKSYQINVDTSNKVVTLTGTIDSEATRTRAVEIARNTNGVASVVDNLTVGAPTAALPSATDATRATYNDASITATVKGKLMANTTMSALKIDVDTSDGVVTLTGNVHSQSVKDEALQLARDTEGVKRVEDKLTIKP